MVDPSTVIFDISFKEPLMSTHRHYSNWLNSEGRDAQHQYIIRNNARLKSPSLRSKILLMPKRNLKGSPIIIYKN